MNVMEVVNSLHLLCVKQKRDCVKEILTGFEALWNLAEHWRKTRGAQRKIQEI